MSWWSDVAERARTLLHRGKEERELADEIAFHLEMETQKNIESGMDAATARRKANLMLGGAEQVKEDVRVARGTRMLENVTRDFTVAVRTLVKRREFSLIVLLILAFGIGANATTFTVIDALLLRGLPVPQADQLITLGDPDRTNSESRGTPAIMHASYPIYRDLRAASGSLVTGLYATGTARRVNVLLDRAADPTAPDRPRTRYVSGNFFDVLQVRAYAGRTFTDAEDAAPGRDPVVVISYDYWQRRLAGDRSAIGREITVNDVPMTIVGVTGQRFFGDIVGERTDMWIPLAMQPKLMPHDPRLDDRTVSWLLMMGRLAPGVSVDQARVAFRELQRRSIMTDAAASDVGAIESRLRDEPLRVEDGSRGFSWYRVRYGNALYTLMAAVTLVLLVVCANVANLMLVRAVGRNREMAVRMAIGAGRGDLIRQLLIESAVLAFAGGALGLLFARWGSTVLLKVASYGPDPIPLDVGLNGSVIAFTAAVSLGTAMLFGLLPALRATRVELTSSLRSQGRGISGTSGGKRMPAGKLLVVGQVALSMVLLVGTGMLVRSTQRLLGADIGVARDELVIASLDAGRSGYTGDRLATLMGELEARVARVPGVSAVTISENGLFGGRDNAFTLQVEGFTAHAEADTVVGYDDVAPDYFTAVGARILLGRDFNDRDTRGAPNVGVINETMRKFYFPNVSPLGKRLFADTTVIEIVGVVADIEGNDLREPEPERRLYIPIPQVQERPASFMLIARTGSEPARAVEPIRAAIKDVDNTLGVSVDALPDLIRGSITQDQMVANVVTFFGALALFLTALGLYGVMAYNATRRVNEFGLRIALGARPADVRTMMLREALVLLSAGVFVGVPAALVVTRLLRAQIFGIGMIDAPSLIAAIIVLAASAAIAGAVPAIRAARTTPLTALSAE